MVGDGTLGEGLLYESLNLASVWSAPVLFVVEYNGIAQTTDTAPRSPATWWSAAGRSGSPAGGSATTSRGCGRSPRKRSLTCASTAGRASW